MKRISALLASLMLMLGLGLVAAGSASAGTIPPPPARVVNKLPPGCSQKYSHEKTSRTIGTFFVTAECSQLGIQPTRLQVVDVDICAVGPILGQCPAWLPWKVSSVKPGYRPSTRSAAANVNIRLAPGSWQYRIKMRGTYQIANRPPLVAQRVLFTNSNRAVFTLFV